MIGIYCLWLIIMLAPAGGSGTAPTLSTLVQIYRAETGVRELCGRNDGKRVEQYLHYVGLRAGNPWCAAFVCWALGKAGIRNPRTGWSPLLMTAGKPVWRRERHIDPQGAAPVRQGDVFGLYISSLKRVAHVGFVDSWQPPWVVTVEGNTNTEGSNEGDGVYRRRWLCKVLYAIVRFEEEAKDDKLLN